MILGVRLADLRNSSGDFSNSSRDFTMCKRDLTQSEGRWVHQLLKLHSSTPKWRINTRIYINLLDKQGYTRILVQSEGIYRCLPLGWGYFV